MSITQFKTLTAFVIFLGLAAIACGSETTASPTRPPLPTILVPISGAPSPVSIIENGEAQVWLEPHGGEQQSGWARIWAVPGSLFVEIEVGPPESGAQPAEILTGTCDSLGPVAHELENVIGGYSLTEIPGLSLADVATGKRLRQRITVLR